MSSGEETQKESKFYLDFTRDSFISLKALRIIKVIEIDI